MDNVNKDPMMEQDDNEALDIDALEGVSGGRMQGNIFTTKTTDISDSTREKI